MSNKSPMQSERSSEEQDSKRAFAAEKYAELQVPTSLLYSSVPKVSNDQHTLDGIVKKCIKELEEIDSLVSLKHRKYVIVSTVSKHAVLAGISALLIDKTENFYSPKNGMLLIICGTLSSTGFYYSKRSAEQIALFDAIGKLDILIQSLKTLQFEQQSENIRKSSETFLDKFKTNYNMTNAFAVIPLIATFFFTFTQMCDESKLAGTILTSIGSILTKKSIDRNIVFKSSLLGILIVGLTNIYYFYDYESESSLSKSIKNMNETLQTITEETDN